MKNYLRQFMEWVTASKYKSNNIFTKARIRLTLFYVLVMIFVLSIFSTVLIYVLEKNIKESFIENIGQEEVLNITVNKTNEKIETLVFTLDLSLLFLIGISSYFLASETLDPIKKALESQKRFSADASHDLRTPLAIITTETEVALRNKNISTRECKEVFKSNLEEVKRMSTLVSDLLSLSRTEQLYLKSEIITVEINSFVQRIVNRIKNQADKKGIHLTMKENISGNIKIHSNNFERALQNIIQNAVNYTLSGGAVDVGISAQKSNFVINITDTGIGISDSDLPHIFDRFYKTSNSRNDSSSSGLGLSIAKQIIELHKGTIDIESEINTGTSVFIKIPKA